MYILHNHGRNSSAFLTKRIQKKKKEGKRKHFYLYMQNDESMELIIKRIRLEKNNRNNTWNICNINVCFAVMSHENSVYTTRMHAQNMHEFCR